jgi:hypothetical protein
MFFMPPAAPGRTGSDVPRGATKVTVGRYRAWLAPSGYVPAGDGPALVRPALVRPALVRSALVIEGDSRDLVISTSGLPRSALVSLVSAGLSAA